ncbi:MAG: hypothetical protein KC910_22060, partial [Candidatus Eremiobacteraeota bacterium]|nr:hypothetical protein [Candidatus Eremiobacteraeota bacterium]
MKPLDQSGPQFFQQRRFRLPWQESLVPSQAPQGDRFERVYVQTDPATAALPVRTAQDLAEVARLGPARSGRPLEHEQLAQDLECLDRAGKKFEAELGEQRQSVGAYGAYNALTDDFGLSRLTVDQLPVDGPDKLHQIATFVTHPEQLGERAALVARLADQQRTFTSQGQSLHPFDAWQAEKVRINGWLPLDSLQPELLKRADLVERLVRAPGHRLEAFEALGSDRPWTVLEIGQPAEGAALGWTTLDQPWAAEVKPLLDNLDGQHRFLESALRGGNLPASVKAALGELSVDEQARLAPLGWPCGPNDSAPQKAALVRAWAGQPGQQPAERGRAILEQCDATTGDLAQRTLAGLEGVDYFTALSVGLDPLT